MEPSYHNKYIKELGTTRHVEAYIQSRILIKTLESVSFDYRRELGKDGGMNAVVTGGSPEINRRNELACMSQN